jgi:hypothetical protein
MLFWETFFFCEKHTMYNAGKTAESLNIKRGDTAGKTVKLSL